jgi:Uncharacterized protein conserved in bacteria
VIVDSSAIVAIMANEPERASFLAAIRSASRPRMSAGTFLETAIVIERNRDPRLSGELDALLISLKIETEPVNVEQAKIGRRAYQRYGKGSGHRAQLNFGDCFAYALAIDTDEPLLFKGDDFEHTDVRRVPVS